MRYDQGRSSATSVRSRWARHWYRRVLVAACAIVAVVSSIVGFAAPAHGGELRRVFLLGDSVTVGATPAIESDAVAHGWSVSIDAEIGRTTEEGAAILASMQGQLPAVVVVELGNNDAENPSVYRDRIDAVMRELVSVHDVIWYSMTPFASWVPAANDELRAASQRWPNLVIADWSTVSATTPGALAGAGPHLQARGAQAFADLLYSALDEIPTRVSLVESYRAPLRRSSRPFTRVSESSQPIVRGPVIGLAAAAWGKRRPLVAPDGGVFSFAGTRFYGSMGASRLERPIVRVRPTPSGLGYWLFANDGGVFAFGDARFCG